MINSSYRCFDSSYQSDSMIHPTSLVDDSAEIHYSVKIGPYAIIGPNVKIGKNTIIGPRVIIEGCTTIGNENQIGAGAIIGNAPQDLKYKGEESFVKIGDNNIIREYVTINRGTLGGGLVTSLGHHNLLMTGVHIGHDSYVGSHCVIAHSSLLGGHVVVNDFATVGALCGVHQYCSIGHYAMVGASSLIRKDVLPFTLAEGNSPRVKGLNVERFKRVGFSKQEKQKIKSIYNTIYKSSLTLSESKEKIKQERKECIFSNLVHEFLEKSTRGIYR